MSTPMARQVEFRDAVRATDGGVVAGVIEGGVTSDNRGSGSLVYIERNFAPLDVTQQTPAGGAEYQHEIVIYRNGVSLHMQGRLPEAVASYARVISLVEGKSAILARQLLAKALFNRGCSLAALGLASNAMDAYADLYAHAISDVADGEIRECVAKGLANWVGHLNVQGKYAKARQLCDIAIDVAKADPNLQDVVGWALASRSYNQVNAGDLLGAIETVDKNLPWMIARSKLDSTWERLVAGSLVSRGHALMRLGRVSEATSSFDDVIQRYADTSNPMVAAFVNEAIAFKPRGKAGVLGVVSRVRQRRH